MQGKGLIEMFHVARLAARSAIIRHRPSSTPNRNRKEAMACSDVSFHCLKSRKLASNITSQCIIYLLCFLQRFINLISFFGFVACKLLTTSHPPHPSGRIPWPRPLVVAENNLIKASPQKFS